MEQQEKITINNEVKNISKKTPVWTLFIVQILCFFYTYSSYGLSNFGGGDPYVGKEATVPIIIIFVIFICSIKLYIDFRKGKNNYKLIWLILSSIIFILTFSILY